MLDMTVLAGLGGLMCIRTYNPSAEPEPLDYVRRCTNPRDEAHGDLCSHCGTRYQADAERRRAAYEEDQRRRAALFDDVGGLKDKVDELTELLVAETRARQAVEARLNALELRKPV